MNNKFLFMEILPSPALPTKEEVWLEDQKIRFFLFAALPLLIALSLVLSSLIAVCIALNFNPLNWLE